jgi:hypothetical protein
MSLSKSCKTITNQDQVRHTNRLKQSAIDFKKTRLYESQTQSSLNKVSDSEFAEREDRLEIYASLRTYEYVWRVFANPEAPSAETLESDEGDNCLLYHHFSRVRIVYIGDDGRWHCSCGDNENFGLVCSHIRHVAKYHGLPVFQGFTYRDCALRHYSAYDHIVALSDPSNESMACLRIRESLKTIARQQGGLFQGPSANKDLLLPFLGASSPSSVKIGARVGESLKDCSSAEILSCRAATVSLEGDSNQHSTAAASLSPPGLVAVSHQLLSQQTSEDVSSLFNAALARQRKKTLEPYERLNPMGKELAALLEAINDPVVTLQFAADMEAQISKAKAILASKRGTPSGNVVSSAVPAKKQPKEHKKQRGW